MEKMLVTSALNELKTLDARIRREIEHTDFIMCAKKSEKKVKPYQTKEEFSKEVMSSYDSINALIDRREKIKSAIVESNAKTMVEICGNTYSVAKAIDMKSSIAYKKILLKTMEIQYSNTISIMNRNNDIMEQKIDTLVSTAFGKESKNSIKEDDYNSIAKPYRESNEYSLVDPIKIKEKIEDLKNFIDEFQSTVDAKLQVSNCVTYIEL